MNIKQVRAWLYVFIFILAALLLFYASNVSNKLNHLIIKYNTRDSINSCKIDSLIKVIQYKDSLHKLHLDNCAMISRDQLLYGKDNIVYIKSMKKLTYELGGK